MEKQCQNLAVTNYRNAAATLPKKRQSSSNNNFYQRAEYKQQSQNHQHQQPIQQYYSSASAAQHLQSSYNPHQISTLSNNQVMNKTHRSSKDSQGSIAKEHSQTAALIDGMSHSGCHHLSRPPPSVRANQLRSGMSGTSRKNNTFQKTISGLTQQQKLLHQNLKATLRSPRALPQNSSAQQLTKRSKDLSSNYGGGATTISSNEQVGKNILSPKRAALQQAIPSAKQLLKKVTANNQRSKSKSSSSGKHTAVGNKLTKATSQKTLRSTQKASNNNSTNAIVASKLAGQAKKPTPQQHCETTGSETYPAMETPTTIQPPISSTTMINASRRKFIQTPRNVQENIMLSQTLLPQKSSMMQRNLSNKLLSPVATTSRTKNQPTYYISPPSFGHNQEAASRPKTHVKTFSLPKGGTSTMTNNESCTDQQLLSLSQSQKQTVVSKTVTGLPPSSKQQYKTHQYTQSLQSAQQLGQVPLLLSGQPYSTAVLQSTASLGSLLAKPPQSSKTIAVQHPVRAGSSQAASNSMTRHLKTTSQTTVDKMSSSGGKVLIAERPKTTMLMQLQQSQPQHAQLHNAPPSQQTNPSHLLAKPYHRQHQSSAMATHHRILSPASSQQQLMTNSSSENITAKKAAISQKSVSQLTQNQTTVIHPVCNGSRLGMQHQRSSGDFSLQTYRHTSQSSQGFTSNATKNHNIFINSGGDQNLQQQMHSAANRMHQRDLSKKALTQERFSTATLKTYKSGKTTVKHYSGGKGPARPTSTTCLESQHTQSHQQAEQNIVLHQEQQQQLKKFSSCRKGSQLTSQTHKRQHTAFTDMDDDGVSSRSAKTHIVDEVLHQQKTEAYRDLQRQPNGSNMPPYGMIVETSSMGQIIEQDDELQEFSIDKEEVAHELDAHANNELAYPSHNSMNQQNSQLASTKISHSASAAWLQLGSKQPKQPQQAHVLDQGAMMKLMRSENRGGQDAGQYLRVMANRAKTAINLNDLGQINTEANAAGGTAFSIRKQSNDTIVQNSTTGKDLLLAKKNSLAMLLVNKPEKNSVARQKGEGSCTGGSQLLERNSQNEIMAVDGEGSKSNDLIKNKSTLMPQGLISESLVNSYMTGNCSIAGQSHKWMCSSKSAKNVMTSCSLGPKSELKQTEQANAENTIRILYNSNQNSTARGDSSNRHNAAQQRSNSQVEASMASKDNVQQSASGKSDRRPLHSQLRLADGQPHTDQLVDQQGLNKCSPGTCLNEDQMPNSLSRSNSTQLPIISTKSKTAMKSALHETAADLVGSKSALMQPIQESFKSTQVDYTDSMNENQITRLTIDQTRDMLIRACQRGDLNTVRSLAQIDKQAVTLDDLVNRASKSSTDGNTPLHHACISGHVDIAELLIRKMSSNVNSTNASGETPLHLACAYAHKGVIERLLLARASTNIKDTLNGNTPLHALAQASVPRSLETAPIQTVSSDTVRQTMASYTNKAAECLLTDDLAAAGTQLSQYLQQQQSLIELILPFAEESKSSTNMHGLMPWQLAQSETIANLLKPATKENQVRAQEESHGVEIHHSRASQIQGQGNQDGRNSVMTRNHSTANNLNKIEQFVHNAATNSIEVKQVSEEQIAGIFTFYQASKADEAGNNLIGEKQFTFQATQPSASNEQAVGANGLQSERQIDTQPGYAQLNYMTGHTAGHESRHSDLYQTLSSKESISDAKMQSKRRQLSSDYQNYTSSIQLNQQSKADEEEKKNIKNFLDDDIEQIDNNFFGQHQTDLDLESYTQHEYGSSQQIKLQKEYEAVKRRRTEQSLLTASDDKFVTSQFLSRMQESQDKQNLAAMHDAQRSSAKQFRRAEKHYQSERQQQEDRQDTPALQRDSRQKSQTSNGMSQAQNTSKVQHAHYQPSKTLPYSSQRYHQHLSNTSEKPGANSGSKQGSTMHQQYSPQKKIVLKAAQRMSKTGTGNQTTDSVKSNAANNPLSTSKAKYATNNGQAAKQMAKVRTVQNLRPQSSTQQLAQSKSTAKIKLAEIVQPFDINQGLLPTSASKQNATTPTNQKGYRSSNQLGTASKTSAPQTVQKTQTSSSKAVNLLRTTSSALDLKQKVDKQAGLLMQRTNSKQILDKMMRIGPEQFVAHQLLGTGSFGEVFLVERKIDKKLLAMKVLSKRKIKRDNLKKYAITERNVMCSMGEHPFIVQLRYAFQTKDHLFLISDYCPGGDLSQYLEIEECFSEEKARLYTQEILLGIEALHKQNIIFRDLKPDNVIIDKKGHAMLTDFGLSRENVRRPTTGAKSFCGSYAYLAPEMLDKKGHGKAVDWYLLGVILFEMVTGLPPYYADDKDQLFKNIIRDTLDMDEIQSKQQLSDECIDLMKKLLTKDPAQRIGTEKGAIEIRSHPFFRDTDWDTVLAKEIPMPEPYLANMAMDIIIQQPYLVAGHPHTTGDICPRQHRSYLPGWSFTQAGHHNLTESQVSDSEKLNLHAVKERANQPSHQHPQQLSPSSTTEENQDLLVRDETQQDDEGAT